MSKAKKKDGLVGSVPEEAITVVLQGRRCAVVKDLIHMIQYEFNHHLLDPNCKESRISIATSGFDFFGPKSWMKHIQ